MPAHNWTILCMSPYNVNVTPSAVMEYIHGEFCRVNQQVEQCWPTGRQKVKLNAKMCLRTGLGVRHKKGGKGSHIPGYSCQLRRLVQTDVQRL